MKKIFALMAVAALFASCAQTDVIEDVDFEETPQAIGFNTFADKQVRANSTALNDFYTTFKVYGWKIVGGAASEVFVDVTNEYFTDLNTNGNVIYTSTKPSAEWNTTSNTAPGWYYENIRYWDKLATAYQFCAYAPIAASSDVVATSDGKITIGASTPVTVDATNLQATPKTALQYTGFATDYMTAVSAATSSDVQLTFTHELAKLNVMIAKATAYTSAQELKVTTLEILNLKNEGSFVRNGGSKVWAPVDSEGTYAITSEKSLTAATNYDGYYVIEQLLLPQGIELAADTYQTSEYTEACVHITYMIGSETFDGFYALNNIFDDANDYTFEGGKEYTLTITVGPDPIYFSTDVTAWTVGADAGLTVE